MTTHTPMHIQLASSLPAPVRTTLPLLALALATLLLGACASTPPPVEKMAVAEAAVERASSAGTR